MNFPKSSEFNHHHTHLDRLEMDTNPYKLKQRVRTDQILQCLVAILVQTDLSINRVSDHFLFIYLILYTILLGRRKIYIIIHMRQFATPSSALKN